MTSFEAGIRYRMPVVFGPMPGPRQRPEGGRWDNPIARIEVIATSFLTESAHLRNLLPPGFELDGEPVVTIEYMYITELQWLAGRGYNTIGVRFPARYSGIEHSFRGPFLSILWENKADPIITGREELGFAKLFCDIPPPRKLGDRRCYEASWEGYRFIEMTVEGLMPATPPEVPPADGMLHYRYVPRVGVPGEAEAHGAVLTPSMSPVEVSNYCVGRGEARFIESSWEQLPTLAHIVNKLAALPIIELRGAVAATIRSDTSLHHHRAIS